jgi:LacI family transcriptional regulator
LPIPANDNSFWTLHPIGITNAQKAADPYQVTTRYFEFGIQDEVDFMSKCKEIIDYQPDGVIMAPLLRKESIAFSKELDGMGIPYVFVDTNIADTNCLAYVGEDAIKSGRVAASLLDVITPLDKDLLIVNIAKNLGNTQHLNSRNQGFMAYFMESGQNKGMKINIDIPGDDELVIKKYLDKVLEDNTNIGAILVSSSRTFAVANYLNKSNKRIALVGYEAIKANIEFLKEDWIQFIVSQRPVEQGEKALQLLLDKLTTKVNPEYLNYQPIDIFNKESVNLL